jgi:hypothetical protein
MAEIDFGEAWDFVDDAGRPRQLRFRRNWAPPGDPRIFDGTSQLIAVVSDGDCADDHDEIAVSRTDIALTEINAALDGWEEWATLLDDVTYRWISLTQIQRRIHDAGLGPSGPQ